jgi:hypothetical protein
MNPRHGISEIHLRESARAVIELVGGRIEGAAIRQPEPNVIRRARRGLVLKVVNLDKIDINTIQAQQCRERPAHHEAARRRSSFPDDPVAERGAEPDDLLIRHGFSLVSGLIFRLNTISQVGPVGSWRSKISHTRRSALTGKAKLKHTSSARQPAAGVP